MNKSYWDLRKFWDIYLGAWLRLIIWSLGLFLNINLFLSNLWCSSLNEWSTMASPSVSSVLTSVLKSVHLVLLFMPVLSALIHKSIHFKQLGSKSCCCPSRSQESCVLEKHWNNSYKYSKKPRGNLHPDANCWGPSAQNTARGKTSHVFKILIVIYYIKGRSLCFPGDHERM